MLFKISNRMLEQLEGCSRDKRVFVVTDAYFNALKIFNSYNEATEFRRAKSLYFITFDTTVGRLMDSPSDLFNHYIQ